jgi:hypothetical protein
VHAQPVVQRVAPQLTVGGEVVGRYAGDDGQAAIRVRAKLFAVCPDVDGVGRDVNRQIAKQQDAARVRIGTQRLPLLLKSELVAAHDLHRFAVHPSRGGERARMSIAQRHRPAPPVGAPSRLTQRAAQCEVIEPVRVVREKGLPRSALGDGHRGAIDERGIARKVGADPVRGTISAGRADRQDLPDRETGAREPVDEASRRTPQAARPQRRQVQQHT